MTTYFVTRHKGAVNWAHGKGIEAVHLDHLDPEILKSGDKVLGTLPVHIAADVCARGTRYMHLTLDLPPDARGKELTAGDMNKFGAKLEKYDVRLIK